jgi:class 3 adenylate cyclase
MSFLNLGSMPRPVPPFGELLRNYRTLRRMTIEQLAESVQVAPGALREIEEGTRPAPPEDITRALATALHLGDDEQEWLLKAAKWDSPRMSALRGRPVVPPIPAALRAAILVFLIADIRGYTRFTQEHGDQAAARLTTRFAELARGVVEQWDGQLVEARGDEVLAVFASAQQAVQAAHDLQARCEAESAANSELPMAIGIGVDVGEAVAVDGGGYRGAALNRASRLCDLAGAGEVLVSSGVVYVAPHVDGVSYEPRGQEQLKGFAGPVPILRAVEVAELPAPGGPTGEVTSDDDR